MCLVHHAKIAGGACNRSSTAGGNLGNQVWFSDERSGQRNEISVAAAKHFFHRLDSAYAAY